MGTIQSNCVYTHAQMAKGDEMKAQLYTTMVTDGGAGMAHGWEFPIQEVFVPERKIIFNKEDGAFREDKARGDKDTKEIEVPDEFILLVETYISAKEKFQEANKKVFGDVV